MESGIVFTLFTIRFVIETPGIQAQYLWCKSVVLVINIKCKKARKMPKVFFSKIAFHASIPRHSALVKCAIFSLVFPFSSRAHDLWTDIFLSLLTFSYIYPLLSMLNAHHCTNLKIVSRAISYYISLPAAFTVHFNCARFHLSTNWWFICFFLYSRNIRRTVSILHLVFTYFLWLCVCWFL